MRIDFFYSRCLTTLKVLNELHVSKNVSRKNLFHLHFLHRKILSNLLKTLASSSFLNLQELRVNRVNLNSLVYSLLSKYRRVPIIFVKGTLKNVFVYIIRNNFILYKRSCGELSGVSKKGRRFFKNVFTLGNDAHRKYLRFRKKGKIKNPLIRFYTFGDPSLTSPVWKVFSRSGFKWRRKEKYWHRFNMIKFIRKIQGLKKRFGSKFFPQPHHLNKLRNQRGKNQSKYDILYIKDITSWAFNGCRSKNRLC